MVCEDHLADPDTVYVFDNHFGERRNPPCNAKDNLRTEYIMIERLVQGLLRESWIKGSSAVRPIDMGRTDGL